MLIDLTQFNITRPEKINYDFPMSNPVHLIDYVKSKSLQTFFKKADEILLKNKITWEYKDLNEHEYIKWLQYYTEKMKELGHDVRATKEWYQEQHKKDVNLKGLFFYQNQKMVGSGIIGLKNNTIHLAYKASDRIKLSSISNSNLGYLIEFWALQLPLTEKPYTRLISMSRNAFGFYNTLGYLEYKFQFGFTPQITEESAMLDSVPVNESSFVLFYGIQNKELILFALIPELQKNVELFNKTPFISQAIPFREIYY